MAHAALGASRGCIAQLVEQLTLNHIVSMLNYLVARPTCPPTMGRLPGLITVQERVSKGLIGRLPLRARGRRTSPMGCLRQGTKRASQSTARTGAYAWSVATLLD